ncbi:MAG TPA: type I glyceraldehyde-3-phosphate dehydrogenase, partial [Actinomycetota bacterium]|nr:type I glyceraldehyde-3-phosphate dehydrogenase [Actinomycetota bacterium]
MTVRVGINGFGRIGRNYFRAAKGTDVDVVLAAREHPVTRSAVAWARDNRQQLGRCASHRAFPDGGVGLVPSD